MYHKLRPFGWFRKLKLFIKFLSGRFESIKIPKTHLYFGFRKPISYECPLTKFRIEKETPIQVVEVPPPGAIGIIWGVLVFLFFSAFCPPRSQCHENPSRLFDFYLRTFLACALVVAVSPIFCWSETGFEQWRSATA